MSVEIKQLKCKVCGSNDLKQLGNGKVECNSCGEKFIVDDTLGGEVRGLLNNGDVELADMDFSKAKSYYLKAIEKDEYAIEAYFGVICATYGIEYVKEKKDGQVEYAPTCHRCSREDIFDDQHVQKLLKLIAGNDLEEDYKSKLNKINDIRKKIATLAQKEAPYDVFICFKAEKQLDGQNVKTDDYHLGYQIYNDLGKNGYKVFFSPESLKGKGGENYEPLIFNALDTSAVMLTLCTENKDYLNTTWVKNEWSRFVELMEHNENKKLIPIFKKTAKMSIDDLPQEFVDKKLQALDSASYDFSTSLLMSIQNARNGFFRGIGGTVKRKDIKNKTGFNMDIKLETRKLEKKKFEQTQATIVIPQKMENLLRMANTPLEVGKYAKAYELFENILKDDPNQYLALWGKILCHTSCTTQKNFSSWGAFRLTDFESLDRLLTIAPTEVAKSYYNDYLNSFLAKCDSKGFDFDKAYDECVKWADESQTKYICNELFRKSTMYVDQNNKILSDKLLEASLELLGENDAKTYVERNLAVGIKWLKKGSFVIAKEYFEKIVKLAPQHKDAKYNMFLCDLGIVDESVGKLNFAIKNATFMDEVEKLIEIDCDVDLLFNNIIKMAYLKIQDNKIELGEKIFQRAAEIMQNILSEQDYINNLLHFADLFLLKESFDFAKKYYMQLLSVDPKFAPAHWGLLKVRYKCQTDYELLLLPQREKTDWTTAVEFANTVGACDEKNAIDSYLDFQYVYEGMDKATKKIIKVAHAQAISNNIVPNIIGDIKSHIKYLQTNKYNVNIVNTFGDMQLVKSTMTKALTNNLTPYEKKIVLFRFLLMAGAVLLGTIVSVVCLLMHSEILIFNEVAFLAASCSIAVAGGIAVGIVLYKLRPKTRGNVAKLCVAILSIATSGVLLMLEFLFGYLIEVGFWGGLVVLAILIVIAIVLSWTVVGKKHIANKTQSSERRSNKKNIKITIAITAVLTLIAMVGNGIGVGLGGKDKDRQFIVRNGVLVGFNADMNKGKVLVIPSVDAVTGKEIHTIGKDAFAKQGFFAPKQLEAETIVISEGIRRIEDGAFSYKKTNKNLISIKTPNSLQYIGDDAFSEQSNLETFSFGDNLGHIGKKAFYNTGIKKFDYCGNANLKIGDYAFGGTKMASIFISKKVTSMGFGAFGNNSVLCTQCTSYAELLAKFEDKEYLKNSYVKIKYNADDYGQDGDYCYTIKNGKATITDFNKSAENEIIKIPDMLGGCKVVNIADGVFRSKTMISIILPTYLEGIGSEAFANCDKLVAVWIGANVRTIGKGAFVGDRATILFEENLTLNDAVNKYGNQWFDSANCSVYPNARELYYDGNARSLVFKKSDNSLGLIKYYGEFKTLDLKNVFGKGVVLTSINAKAVYKNYSLRKVYVPKTVTQIESHAFEYCEQLDLYFEGSEQDTQKYDKSFCEYGVGKYFNQKPWA